MKRICPICGSKDKDILLDVKFINDIGNPLPSRNEVVCCNSCGFCFADNDATQDLYDIYYSQHNIYAEDRELKAGGHDDPYNYPAKFIADNVDKADSILDVGCGDGTLLYKLKQMGFTKLTGMDPSAASIEIVESYGIKGICENIFKKRDELLNAYDVIVSSCVIEHIFDLNGYIASMASMLNTDGRLILFAPAVEGFVRKITDIANYFNMEHINYFTLQSMDNLMNKHGFCRETNVDKSTYVNTIEEMFFSIVYRYRGGVKQKTIYLTQVGENLFKLI